MKLYFLDLSIHLNETDEDFVDEALAELMHQHARAYRVFPGYEGSASPRVGLVTDMEPDAFLENLLDDAEVSEADFYDGVGDARPLSAAETQDIEHFLDEEVGMDNEDDDCDEDEVG